MTSKNAEKDAARLLQEETGMNYQGALRIVRGQVRYRPTANDCRIAAVIAKMVPSIQETIRTSPTPPRACQCARCDP